MMHNVHILTDYEYNELIHTIHSLEEQVTETMNDAAYWQYRFDRLYKLFNKEAYEQLEAAHHEELLQWCEDQAAKYDELDYRTWCEEQAHLYNDGVIVACKKYHCEPKDVKYVGWVEEKDGRNIYSQWCAVDEYYAEAHEAWYYDLEAYWNNQLKDHSLSLEDRGSAIMMYDLYKSYTCYDKACENANFWVHSRKEFENDTYFKHHNNNWWNDYVEYWFDRSKYYFRDFGFYFRSREH